MADLNLLEGEVLGKEKMAENISNSQLSAQEHRDDEEDDEFGGFEEVPVQPVASIPKQEEDENLKNNTIQEGLVIIKTEEQVDDEFGDFEETKPIPEKETDVNIKENQEEEDKGSQAITTNNQTDELILNSIGQSPNQINVENKETDATLNPLNPSENDKVEETNQENIDDEFGGFEEGITGAEKNNELNAVDGGKGEEEDKEKIQSENENLSSITKEFKNTIDVEEEEVYIHQTENKNSIGGKVLFFFIFQKIIQFQLQFFFKKY